MNQFGSSSTGGRPPTAAERLHLVLLNFKSAETEKPAAAESACRQYRAVRWFLLPEAEFAAAGSGQRIANMAWRSSGNLRSIAFTEMSDYESLAKMQGSLVPAILPM